LFNSKSPKILHLETRLIVHLKTPWNCASQKPIKLFISYYSGTHFLLKLPRYLFSTQPTQLHIFYSNYSGTHFLLEVKPSQSLIMYWFHHFHSESTHITLCPWFSTEFLLNFLNYHRSHQSIFTWNYAWQLLENFSNRQSKSVWWSQVRLHEL